MSMNVVGYLTNIAPGEKIYSIRFSGQRAYMVTFVQTDPLFTIGFGNDPKQPELLGELKVPGMTAAMKSQCSTSL